MIPKFEYDTPLQGFDTTVTPNWYMVPLGAKKEIYLRGGDELGVTSASRQSSRQYDEPLNGNDDC